MEKEIGIEGSFSGVEGMGHRPVLVDRVMEVLEPKPGKIIIDGTFGRGGHADLLLQAGATVWAMDRDLEAVQVGMEWVKKWGKERFQIMQADFKNWNVWLEKKRGDEKEGSSLGDLDGVDGLLLDLGVSSPQLDDPKRGFSYRLDGPLDMRMNASSSGGVTAADMVNHLSEEDLAMIFKTYGEEKMSRAVARAIVRRRSKTLFSSTLDLASCVASVVGKRRGELSHPAARVFQALRIAVNRELESLEFALASVRGLLKSGGRLAVITFHSLEDRIVKRFIQNASCMEVRRPELAIGLPNPNYFLKNMGDWAADEEEIKINPRARSARLRAAERV